MDLCGVAVHVLGTSLRYKPGVIVGGANLSHDCPPSRSVGYFLEGLVLLAPFGKHDLSITLRGVTNDEQDISVQYVCSFQWLANYTTSLHIPSHHIT